MALADQARSRCPHLRKTHLSKIIPAIRKQSCGSDWGVFGVGLISFLVPLIGYFLYRAYEENSDSKAGIALTASILGVLAHVAQRNLSFFKPIRSNVESA